MRPVTSRRILTAALLACVVVAGTVGLGTATATAATQRTAAAGCPRGYSCLYDGTNFTGGEGTYGGITTTCSNRGSNLGWRSMRNPSRFQGYVYAGYRCDGPAHLVHTYRDVSTFGFTAHSMRWACVVCRSAGAGTHWHAAGTAARNRTGATAFAHPGRRPAPPACTRGYTCFYVGIEYSGVSRALQNLHACSNLPGSYRSANNNSRFQGYVYSDTGCRGRARAISTSSADSNFGFAARSVKYACIACRGTAARR